MKANNHLVTILLPASRAGTENAAAHRQTKQELFKRFGGLTRYTQNPAEGLWKNERNSTERDVVVVYEIMTPKLDKKWWKHYRQKLELRFRQSEIVVRAMKIKLL
jgi:hypothetical protein